MEPNRFDDIFRVEGEEYLFLQAFTLGWEMKKFEKE
jgi:hypothetical protein